MSFNSEHAIETFRSLISISTELLRSLLLLNGGAIVALLAYVGQAANGPDVAKDARWSLILFVVGLILAAAAFIGAYLTQLALYNESVHSDEYKGRHNPWLVGSFIVAVASLIAFSCGAFAGLSALSHGHREALQPNKAPQVTCDDACA